MPQSNSLFARLALGLITVVGIQPAMAGAGDDTPIRAWVEFDEQGQTVTISAHAVASRPMTVRYALVIESVSDAGTTRSRDSSHIQLHTKPATLTRISLSTTDPRRIEVSLDVEPDGAAPLQVRETYPMSGAWVMAH